MFSTVFNNNNRKEAQAEIDFTRVLKDVNDYSEHEFFVVQTTENQYLEDNK